MERLSAEGQEKKRARRSTRSRDNTNTFAAALTLAESEARNFSCRNPRKERFLVARRGGLLGMTPGGFSHRAKACFISGGCGGSSPGRAETTSIPRGGRGPGGLAWLRGDRGMSAARADLRLPAEEGKGRRDWKDRPTEMAISSLPN